MTVGIRVLHLSHLPAPYRIPVFNQVAAEQSMAFRVLFLAESEAHRAWPIYYREMRFDHRVLGEYTRFQRGGTWYHVNRGLIGELRRWQPDVVLSSGWEQPASLLAFSLRRLMGYRYICWIESTLRDQRSNNPAVSWVKRQVVAGSDALLVPGRASAEYVRRLGASESDVHVAPNAVDNDLYEPSSSSERGHGEVTFLYVGRLHPEKGMQTLRRAWDALPSRPVRLVLAGDGPLRSEMSSWAQVAGNVELTGHLEREDLAKLYSDADALVFPSLSDPWGLVINEAMASGLPIVTTTVPGAVDDLVEDGANGFVVPPGDHLALAAAMEKLTQDLPLRLRMGEASREMIRTFSPEACARGIIAAVQDVSQRRA